MRCKRNGTFEILRFIPYFQTFTDPPDVVVLILGDENEKIYYEHQYNYLTENIPDFLYQFGEKENVVLNGYNYILDSVIISNTKNHTICALKIKDKKYIYDGKLRKTYMEYDENNIVKDFRIPCHLEQHDWNLNDNIEFSINTMGCGIKKEVIGSKNNELFFNMSRGKRLLVYIKQNKIKQTNTISKPHKCTRSTIKKRNQT